MWIWKKVLEFKILRQFDTAKEIVLTSVYNGHQGGFDIENRFSQSQQMEKYLSNYQMYLAMLVGGKSWNLISSLKNIYIRGAFKKKKKKKSNLKP